MRDPPVSVSPKFPSPPTSLLPQFLPILAASILEGGTLISGRGSACRTSSVGVAGLLLRLRARGGALSYVGVQAVASGGNPRSVSGYKTVLTLLTYCVAALHLRLFESIWFCDHKMSKVHAAFQEFQHRRDGLIKALTANLDTIIEEAKKIGKETPYDQRKCLWGLEDKSWELRHAEYPCSEAPPQPEPLPPFEEGMSLIEWIRIVADFSYAWLATFSAYLSSSFTLEERKELLKEIRTLPFMRDVVVLEDKYTS